LRRFRLAPYVSASAVAALIVTPLVLAACGGRSSGKPSVSRNSNPFALSPLVSAIPGALFDPSSVDKIARAGSYSAWVRLDDEQVADLAVWQSATAARRAVQRYRAGGPDTRPVTGGGPYGAARTVRRVDRVRNVTLAWYTQPKRIDETTFRDALLFGKGSDRRSGVASPFASVSDIPGALFVKDWSSDIARRGTWHAVVLLAPPDHPVDVAIWPSDAAAKHALNRYRASGPDTRTRSIDT
jgi:hypothetical protein